jgi:hypothetical protein
MKRTLITASLFLCAIYVTAQTYPNQSSNPSSSQTSSQSTSDHHAKVRGCLSGSSGNYTLTDKSGNAYQLSGDTSKLAEHVGHTIEITGTTAPSSAGGSSSSGSSSATGGGSAAGGGAAQTLNVTSMKHISETCTSSK